MLTRAVGEALKPADGGTELPEGDRLDSLGDCAKVVYQGFKTESHDLELL